MYIFALVSQNTHIKNNMKLTHWKAQNTDNAKFLGTLALENGDTFEIVETATHLCFGGACNVGFLESGNMEKEESASTDDELAELLEELETYYRDGSQFCNRIQCNERM